MELKKNVFVEIYWRKPEYRFGDNFVTPQKELNYQLDEEKG